MDKSFIAFISVLGEFILLQNVVLFSKLLLNIRYNILDSGNLFSEEIESVTAQWSVRGELRIFQLDIKDSKLLFISQ